MEQGEFSEEDESQSELLVSDQDWDVAIRYHELKRDESISAHEKHALRESALGAILRRAQEMVGSISHPKVYWHEEAALTMAQPVNSEIDWEETLSELPRINRGTKNKRLEKLDFECFGDRAQPLVLCVDTSLSMTGEKLALTSVALAIVLLQFHQNPLALVTFESRASLLWEGRRTLHIRAALEKFIEVPAEGYTDLEEGLRLAYRQVQSLPRPTHSRPPQTILLTDGKYTAGRDPSSVAARFRGLHVLKMGSDRSSEDFCRELARRGAGTYREAQSLSSLPNAMLQVTRELLRGKRGAC
jgi:Mg-chelatase subunit ChlD